MVDLTPFLKQRALIIRQWQWDPEQLIYVNPETGEEADEDDRRAWLLAALLAAGVVADTLAESLWLNEMSLNGWAAAMRREILDEYIRAYLNGIGGLPQMTGADWKAISDMLEFQYERFAGFVEEIGAGKLTQGQIGARSRMYLNSARQAFEKANARTQEKAGNDEIFWQLNPGVENCPDCQAFNALGWQPVAGNPYGGCVPGSGCTVCLTNCYCYLSYRRGA